MITIAEIIAGEPGDARRSAFVARVRELRERGFLQSAELFENVESIRDANYGYLALLHYDDEQALFDEEADPAVERVATSELIRLGRLAPTAPGNVWLINPFEIGASEIESALCMWDRAKDHMVAHPGFMNARLFRARSASARYGLVNISQWRSAEQFKAALADRAYDRHREKSLGYTLHPSLCRRVFDLGEPGHAPSPAERRSRVPAAA